MGLPQIDIKFKSLAKSAIERGSKGIVALILKDNKKTDGIISIESIKDIPEDLSEENRKQLELAFKGGYKAPIKVIYVAIDNTGKLEDGLNIMESEIWDFIAIPCLEDGEGEKVASWIKGLREDNIKVQAILPNVKADNEGVINITTPTFKTKDKTYTSKEYASRFAGIFAGTPLNISATYFVLPEVLDVEHLRKKEEDERIDKGELIVINDGEKCKIARAINSLTTIIEGKSEDYKKIKIVSTMDLVYRDIRKTFEDLYVGKFPNSYDNQVAFTMSINAYLESLEKDGVLARKQNNVYVDIDAISLYLKKKGIEISNMKKQDIEEIPIGAKLFLGGKLRILDAMEDLQLIFEI